MDIKTKLYVTKIFANDLVAIRKSKIALIINKPAYFGMCILDLSKILTQEFHYDYIKNTYANNSRLLFTDTDSLMYEIKTEDVMKIIAYIKKSVAIKELAPYSQR